MYILVQASALNRVPILETQVAEFTAEVLFQGCFCDRSLYWSWNTLDGRLMDLLILKSPEWNSGAYSLLLGAFIWFWWLTSIPPINYNRYYWFKERKNAPNARGLRSHGLNPWVFFMVSFHVSTPLVWCSHRSRKVPSVCLLELHYALRRQGRLDPASGLQG